MNGEIINFVLRPSIKEFESDGQFAFNKSIPIITRLRIDDRRCMTYILIGNYSQYHFDAAPSFALDRSHFDRLLLFFKV